MRAIEIIRVNKIQTKCIHTIYNRIEYISKT